MTKKKTFIVNTVQFNVKIMASLKFISSLMLCLSFSIFGQNSSKNQYSKKKLKDSEKIVLSISDKITTWTKQDRLEKVWGSLGNNVNTTTRGERSSQLHNLFIKFLDKKISESINESKKGTKMHRIALLQKKLSPKINTKLGNNFKLTLRGKLLEQKIKIHIDNSILNYDLEFFANQQDNLKMKLYRSIASIGTYTEINYKIASQRFELLCQKQIIKNISAKYSFINKNDQLVLDNQDNKLELIYNFIF